MLDVARVMRRVYEGRQPLVGVLNLERNGLYQQAAGDRHPVRADGHSGRVDGHRDGTVAVRTSHNERLQRGQPGSGKGSRHVVPGLSRRRRGRVGVRAARHPVLPWERRVHAEAIQDGGSVRGSPWDETLRGDRDGLSTGYLGGRCADVGLQPVQRILCLPGRLVMSAIVPVAPVAAAPRVQCYLASSDNSRV